MKILITLFIVFFVISGGLFFLKNPPPKKVLKVMVYSSFVNVFGPGPLIKKEFEKTCDCQVKWLKVPDSTLFAQRLSLKKDGFKTDVVLGLDQITLKSVSFLSWREIPTPHLAYAFLRSGEANLKLTIDGQSLPAGEFKVGKPEQTKTYFVPYNWSPMSLLSRKPQKQTLSLKDLLHPSFQHNISLPSPRSSTVGLQFYYWIWSVFKEQTAEFLKSFKKQLYGLSPSWSTSYALFQRGHVDFSFSYLSSLIYHRQQKQEDFHFVFFKEGHPFQVEMAGVPHFCTKCDLATRFVLFLLRPEIQNILKTKNYMLPVISSSEKNFAVLKDMKFISYSALPHFLEQKPKWLKQWDSWLKKP